MSSPFRRVRRTRRQLIREAALVGTAAAGSSSLLAGCSDDDPGGMPRSETLISTGLHAGPPTGFNPLAPSAAFPVGNEATHLYEPLFHFNLLAGDIDPVLASNLVWDGDAATVTLYEGTTWQDGEPLTAHDVEYTFGLPQRHDGIGYGAFWDFVDSFTAEDDRTLRLVLNPERRNPGVVTDFLVTTYIVPRHIWEPREGGEDEQAITELENLEPVGSGPYTLRSFSLQDITLERHDAYWGNEVHGQPVPRFLVHAIFEGNDPANLAFQNGETDLSQDFLPRVWELWENRDLPVGTWFREPPYHLPGSIPILLLNVNRAPLDNPVVRRALAHAIDYAQIAETAMARYSSPAMASLVLPQGAEEEHFDEDRAGTAWSFNPDEARRILTEEAGATLGDDGVFRLPDGTRLGPLVAQTPHGWTDWNAALEVLAQSVKEAGFEVETRFDEAPQVTTAVQNGDFDMALWYISGVGPASPWSRFRDILEDRGVPEAGETAFWNYGRYQNSEVHELLDAAAGATGADQAQLYRQLDDVFRRDVPAIPLMYRPLEFFQFHETHWTGFPTAADPHSPPTQGRGGVKMLTQLRPVSR